MTRARGRVVMIRCQTGGLANDAVAVAELKVQIQIASDIFSADNGRFRKHALGGHLLIGLSAFKHREKDHETADQAKSGDRIDEDRLPDGRIDE